LSPEHEQELEVHIKSLKTNARTHFKLPPTATLGQLWETASDREHLDEPRAEGDTLRCNDGSDLTNELELTLAQLAESGRCHGRQFEIRGPSGGALLGA